MPTIIPKIGPNGVISLKFFEHVHPDLYNYVYVFKCMFAVEVKKLPGDNTIVVILLEIYVESGMIHDCCEVL